MHPTAAKLRARIAEQRIRVYELAPAVGLHPTRLGQVLNERLPLTPELSERIQRALDQADRPAR